MFQKLRENRSGEGKGVIGRDRYRKTGRTETERIRKRRKKRRRGRRRRMRRRKKWEVATALARNSFQQVCVCFFLGDSTGE